MVIVAAITTSIPSGKEVILMEMINSNLGYIDVASIIGMRHTDFVRLPRVEQVNWLRKVHSGKFFKSLQNDDCLPDDLNDEEDYHITNYIIVDDLI